MDLQYLRRLMKLFTDSGIDELEIEEETGRIRLLKNNHSTVVHTSDAAFLPMQHSPAFTQVSPATATQPVPEPADTRYHELRSPIVGTFYRAPAPDADPFVTVGQTVQAGQTVCIVEAMKIWNEIEADVSGKIVKILVENAQAIEYNQVLFLIDPQ
jgi:acetyl-CoA carboxylase biotin carboxyl carrier protein